MKMQPNKKVKICLEPLGREIEVDVGTALKDVLFEQGVEFPCGGRGICRKCRIKILKGNLAVNEVQKKAFTSDEINQGWRLACQCQVTEPLVIELAQLETPILADASRIKPAGESGLAVAVDLGTTTLVAQLLDLSSGIVLGVETALNSQAQYGADIMSRIQFGLKAEGRELLQNLIRRQIGQMIARLIEKGQCPERRLKQVNIVGNSAMHHLFGGLSVEPLAVLPFEIEQPGELEWSAKEIGWQLPGNPKVKFLPCLGGFVGSDILAGILAVGMHRSPEPVALIDLGTNGEVVIGNREKILCASTAAGPAFEGAQIAMGMRATTGAIGKVWHTDGQLQVEVIGNVPARGICGSGLVDAIAASLDLGWIDSTGRITLPEREIPLQKPVVITQSDVRELQLAKGAIAAGIQILRQQLKLKPADIKQVFLAGAFGNYINVTSARRIGLLDFPAEVIDQAGNTALRGVKLSLIDEAEYRRIPPITRHIPLATDARFMEIFAENMNFPD
ncbi:MAG TPA: ASKHA domain-containing protein [Candidatus Marinimicrobia bacterium]|nr:ASKHA domain-containing protein [Candidatus Neomarinimicrobiota bacterium]HRU93207.1 ASKHA domain-containing protein [Candidatus Neomarinimicrobiota bacterium]